MPMGPLAAFPLAAIEAAAVRGWPAREAMAVDGWLWRQTSGGSIRANTTATLAYTGTDVALSIDAIERLARDRGVPACFTVCDASMPSDLDARLAARGYTRGTEHVTMAKSVDPAAPAPAAIELATAPSPGWLAAYLSGLSIDRRPVATSILARLPRSAIYVAALTNGVTISSGLTIPDGAVASVQCMATLPDARRQGGGERVLAAIEHAAARHGVTVLYLQTSADNTAAQALYRNRGFRIAGHYHTRAKVL